MLKIHNFIDGEKSRDKVVVGLEDVSVFNTIISH